MIRFFLLSTFACFVGAAPLCADLPVKLFFYAQIEPLQQAAKNLSQTEAPNFIRALEKAQNDLHVERRPFFRKEDTSFTQVGEHPLFHGLRELIKPMLKKNEVEKVQEFLKEITDSKMIQGYQLARRGGPFHVVLKLTVDDKGFWILSAHYRQFQVLDGYQGPTFFSPLGIQKKDR